MKKYRSIFISDVHLGSRGCQAEALTKFLKENTSDNLFLVGDIVDGWRLKSKWYWPQSHSNVLRRILTAAKRGTNVHYILGNHDEFFRAFLRFRLTFGRVKMSNRHVYTGVDGKRYLITHGDMFDRLMRSDGKWLMRLGDYAYDFAVWVNVRFNSVRRILGLDYWSLSKWLKTKTKKAVAFVHRYEEQVAGYCKRKGFDGVICGHIHVAEIKDIDGITYMNDGDWVESCSALVEHHDGRWELLFSKVTHEGVLDDTPALPAPRLKPAIELEPAE